MRTDSLNVAIAKRCAVTSNPYWVDLRKNNVHDGAVCVAKMSDNDVIS